MDGVQYEREVDGVQYERYWLVHWANWSMKPQSVAHAATKQADDSNAPRVGRNWYWVREQDMVGYEEMKAEWSRRNFAPYYEAHEKILRYEIEKGG